MMRAPAVLGRSAASCGVSELAGVRAGWGRARLLRREILESQRLGLVQATYLHYERSPLAQRFSWHLWMAISW